MSFRRKFRGDEEAWQKLLQTALRDPEKAFRTLQEFVEGPGYFTPFRRGRRTGAHAPGRLFKLCPSAHTPIGGVPGGPGER